MALAGFWLLERWLGSRAMMPLALFSSYEFIGLTTLTFLLYAAMAPVATSNSPICGQVKFPH